MPPNIEAGFKQFNKHYSWESIKEAAKATGHPFLLPVALEEQLGTNASTLLGYWKTTAADVLLQTINTLMTNKSTPITEIDLLVDAGKSKRAQLDNVRMNPAFYGQLSDLKAHADSDREYLLLSRTYDIKASTGDDDAAKKVMANHATRAANIAAAAYVGAALRSSGRPSTRDDPKWGIVRMGIGKKLSEGTITSYSDLVAFGHSMRILARSMASIELVHIGIHDQIWWDDLDKCCYIDDMPVDQVFASACSEAESVFLMLYRRRANSRASIR